MSTPRTKRQFTGSSADPAQRQITSFFASRALGDAADGPQPQAPRQPVLPSSVQSNLLSVGMRVRKSVPEGYKTSGTNAFKLWTDTTTPAQACRPATQTTLRAASRELLPFCGINKVGGLDSQPAFPCDKDEDEDEDEDEQDPVPQLDDVPELTMSQESVASNASDLSRKRSHSDDDRADCPTLLALPSKGWDDQVSPRSFAPSQWGNSRVMAVPRTRVKKRPSLKDVDQENMAVDGDFGEAEFLVIRDARDMDLS